MPNNMSDIYEDLCIHIEWFVRLHGHWMFVLISCMLCPGVICTYKHNVIMTVLHGTFA